jgi:hypothetical protein
MKVSIGLDTYLDNINIIANDNSEFGREVNKIWSKIILAKD